MLVILANAYLNAPCWGKLWTKTGSEFGSEKGYILLIVRCLYGLKPSGAAWISKPAYTHRSKDSDPDAWIERSITENATAY